VTVPWFAALVDEFKALDVRRRDGGLSLGDAARYHALMAQLTEVMSGRQLAADIRHFLRVPRPVRVSFTRGSEAGIGIALDFGSGGLCLSCDLHLAIGEQLFIERAVVDGETFAIGVRSTVVWGGDRSVGLQFEVESRAAWGRLDRVFYRIFDAYLRDGGARPTMASPRGAQDDVESRGPSPAPSPVSDQ
jgi:hypothetical protein